MEKTTGIELDILRENVTLANLAAYVSGFNEEYLTLQMMLDGEEQEGYSARMCLASMRDSVYKIAETAYHQQMRRIEAEGRTEPDNNLVVYLLKQIGEI